MGFLNVSRGGLYHNRKTHYRSWIITVLYLVDHSRLELSNVVYYISKDM